jgi:hypothetical protein
MEHNLHLARGVPVKVELSSAYSGASRTTNDPQLWYRLGNFRDRPNKSMERIPKFWRITADPSGESRIRSTLNRRMSCRTMSAWSRSRIREPKD